MKPGTLLAPLRALVVPTVAMALALLASLAVVAAAGYPALEAASALFAGAFGSPQALTGTLEAMVPLELVALGWIVAFSARRINVGFEGQILVGGVVAAAVALTGTQLPGAVRLPAAVAGAGVAGAAYAGVAAALWAFRNVNEIISTFMLNLVAVLVLNWLVRGPLQEPTHSLPESGVLPQAARWPRLVASTGLTWDVVLIPLAVALVLLVLSRTAVGFRLRMTGANRVAAAGAGFATTALASGALVASGALGGVAGSSLVLASLDGVVKDNFSAGYGFDGIVAALLARNSPLGTIPAALVLGALRQGGGLMEARVGVSESLIQVTLGLVIFLLAAAPYAAPARLLRPRRRRRQALPAVPLERPRG